MPWHRLLTPDSAPALARQEQGENSQRQHPHVAEATRPQRRARTTQINPPRLTTAGVVAAPRERRPPQVVDAGLPRRLRRCRGRLLWLGGGGGNVRGHHRAGTWRPPARPPPRPPASVPVYAPGAPQPYPNSNREATVPSRGTPSRGGTRRRGRRWPRPATNSGRLTQRRSGRGTPGAPALPPPAGDAHTRRTPPPQGAQIGRAHV